MESKVADLVKNAKSLYDLEFSDLHFIENDPEELKVDIGEDPIRFVHIDLPHTQFLHLHSITLLDASGSAIDLTDKKAMLSVSSTYGGAAAGAGKVRMFTPEGRHEAAFHTKKDVKPWALICLEKSMTVTRIVLKNRPGASAVRARGIRMHVSQDAMRWMVVYDAAQRNEALRASARNLLPVIDRVSPRILGLAVETAIDTLQFAYKDAVERLEAAKLPREEYAWIRKSINREILSCREREWTSHGPRRSFRFWGHQEKRDYVALTVDVCNDLAELSPDVCFGFGSVLSIVRDKALMQHDDDLDIIVGFRKEQASCLTIALDLVKDCLELKGYKVTKRFFSHWHVYRDGKKVDVFVGIYEEGDRIGWFPGTRMALDRNSVFPPQQVEFLGSECAIPRHSEAYLATVYGPQWKEPLPGWRHDWNRSSYRDLA